MARYRCCNVSVVFVLVRSVSATYVSQGSPPEQLSWALNRDLVHCPFACTESRPPSSAPNLLPGAYAFWLGLVSLLIDNTLEGLPLQQPWYPPESGCYDALATFQDQLLYYDGHEKSDRRLSCLSCFLAVEL